MRKNIPIETAPNLLDGLKAIAEAKHIPNDVVLDALREAIVMAARKYKQMNKNFDVDIDEETGEIKVKLSVEVVEDYPDYPADATAIEVEALDAKYMLLDEARDYNPDVEVGDVLEEEVPIEVLNRTAVMAAKQLLMMKTRAAENARIVAENKDRIGMLQSGTVQQIDRGELVVKIGTTEAVMPLREQIRRERYAIGDAVLGVIDRVDDTPRGAKVILSRASGRFLVELLRKEVPEIADGVVEVKGVARDPGFRAKVAVASRDDRIDPVGACVGMRGTRIQNVVRELSNERIDIVQWTSELPAYIRKALSPANIVKMVEVKGTDRILLVIGDEDLSQAIGRNGQNVRLASKLVGRNLEIIGESDYMAHSEAERQAMAMPREGDRPLEDASASARASTDLPAPRSPWRASTTLRPRRRAAKRVAKSRIPESPSIVCEVLKNCSSSFILTLFYYTKNAAFAAFLTPIWIG